MSKILQEIRDPIHDFIMLDADEIKVVDSRPFQRLRHIHQLATTYLVYPGATHRRFEHSLGVMELASRIYDVITAPQNVEPKIRELFPKIGDSKFLDYWRRALRIAALCHDIGHLPFSHAAEDELLPEGIDHENLTMSLIRSKEMKQVWDTMSIPVREEDIIKLAVGPKKLKEVTFNVWEAILSEIIVGDAFGADRIDYLLRDSYHAGVSYGRFDHHRLINTLRIIPKEEDSLEPALGIEEGGLRAAEGLLIARFFMYMQVYMHRVRRIYDIHLKDFLKDWLPGGVFSTKVEDHLRLTDNEVTAAFLEAAVDSAKNGHDPAYRIVHRKHFKLLYQRNPEDVKINPDSGKIIYQAACDTFGKENVRYDKYIGKGGSLHFPVKTKDGRVVSSHTISETISNLPVVAVEYVFISPDLYDDAESWLKQNRNELIMI